MYTVKRKEIGTAKFCRLYLLQSALKDKSTFELTAYLETEVLQPLEVSKYKYKNPIVLVLKNKGPVYYVPGPVIKQLLNLKQVYTSIFTT